MTQNEESTEQVDLLYATSIGGTYLTPDGTTKPTSNTIDLQFNHALSKVLVDASNENPNIYVDIKEVALLNVVETGHFLFPFKNLLPAFKPVDTDERTMILTSEVAERNMILHTSGSMTQSIVNEDNAFMVLPVDYSEAENVALSGTFNPSENQCIRILCRIWNVADSETWKDDSTSNDEHSAAPDLQLYGENGDYKYLYIPIVFNWNMNTIYKYCISFGNGNAGYQDDGSPALVKVNYSVSYSDWEPETVEVPVNEPI